MTNAVKAIREANKMHLTICEDLIDKMKKEIVRFENDLKEDVKNVPDHNGMDKNIHEAEKAEKNADDAVKTSEDSKKDIDKEEKKDEKEVSKEEKTIIQKLDEMKSFLSTQKRELEQIGALIDDDTTKARELRDCINQVNEIMAPLAKLPPGEQAKLNLKDFHSLLPNLVLLREKLKEDDTPIRGALRSLYRFAKKENRDYLKIKEEVGKLTVHPDIKPELKTYLTELTERIDRELGILTKYEAGIIGEEKETQKTENDLIGLIDKLKEVLEKTFPKNASYADNPYNKNKLNKGLDREEFNKLFPIFDAINQADSLFKRLLIQEYNDIRNFHSAVRTLISEIGAAEEKIKELS